MKGAFIIFFLVGILFSCTDEPGLEVNTIIEETAQISTPKGIKLTSGNYSLKIDWDSILSSKIKGYRIYRDTVPNPKKLRIEVGNICGFVDKLLMLNKKYYYQITAIDKQGNETDKSIEVFGIPNEPINNQTPINGEIGGLHYAYWDFGNPSFTKISHEFTIYNEPKNQDGTLNNDGLYYQFYQGVINDNIGFYYGIQTAVFNPNGGAPKRGLIFSRWGTRDINNYKIAPGGFGQSAGYEGDFIGVRLSYNWGVGRYKIEVKLDNTDSIGDWYGFYITNLSSNEKTYAGSIRFEKTFNSSGIKNGGITWTELYFKDKQTTPLPNWHLSVDKVLADDLPPVSVNVNYAAKKFVGFTNIFTTNNADVHFLMGPKVQTVTSPGKLWINN
jgi:hypothetical protein